MSRSGYTDDCGGWSLIRWRGAVNSAIKGARGQAFLKELADALDAMPQKRLIRDHLSVGGEFCAIGVLGHLRGIDISGVDADDREAVAALFGIAPALAAEIVFENDEAAWGTYTETPEARWSRMRKWVEDQIIKPDAAEGATA